MSSQKQEATTVVPSNDDSNKKTNDKNKSKKLKDVLDPNEELSEEDKKLKEKLDLLVERIQDSDINLALNALKDLKNEIRSSTSSMTSVPKPLKFLKDHYDNIKSFYDNIIVKNNHKNTKDYTDLMSILAMTMEDPNTRLCLKYRIKCDNNNDDMISWGTQYIKHLCAEIRMEMAQRQDLTNSHDPNLINLIPFNDIIELVKKIIIFYMDNNSEPEACDVLLEVEKIELIKDVVKEHNHDRVCQYLRSCASYFDPPEDMELYRLCFDIYLKFKNFYQAMRFALKLDDIELVRYVMRYLENRPVTKKQCAYLLGWHQFGYDDDYECDNDEIAKYPINESDLIPESWDNDDDIKEDIIDDGKDNTNDDDDDDEIEINDIIANAQLSESFHNLATDLDVLDPKDPETDIFKEQLIDNMKTSNNVISAKKQLAISYVNAFIHAGFGKDKYMCSGQVIKSNEWIAKNKAKGQLASIASIGSIMLWDEEAVNLVDRYFGSQNENQIRAGAYLAIGMSCSGMRSESGVGIALLQKPIENDNGNVTTLERITSIFGLGMAYAGQANMDVFDIISPCVNTDEPNELSSIAALSLGLVFVGTCDSEISNILICDLLERDSKRLNDSIYLYNALGLGLLFLQKREKVEVALEAIEAFDSINKKYANTLRYTLESLAYAGTGSVLKIQKFMSIVGQHFDSIHDDNDTNDDNKDTTNENEQTGEMDVDNNASGSNNNKPKSVNPFQAYKEERKEEKKDDAKDNDDDDDDNPNKWIEDYRYYQNIALLGISLISMGDEISLDMSIRMFNHFIQYGNLRIKRCVPLGLALQFVSNPRLEVADILSKLSHDHDKTVSLNAIIGLGIISSGTNNSRIATMLRDLTNYYSKDNDHLYCIRIAQGLTHMGKGLLTINPYHSDRFLLSKVSLSGILTLLFSLFDIDNTLLGGRHWILYSLIMSMKPRMLITLNKKCTKNVKINVRVGQALDVVGKAGKPQTITGFQTHDTPVLLSYKDRAQLANDDYIAISPILEGFAIVRKNKDKPDSKKDKKKKKQK